MISVMRSSPARATDHIVLFPTPSGRPLKTDHARDLMRDAGLLYKCTPHRRRYTFATRAIRARPRVAQNRGHVGHKTAEMAFKYTEKRRRARLANVTLDAAHNVNRDEPKCKPLLTGSVNRSDRRH